MWTETFDKVMDRRRYRALLSLVFAIFAILLVGCGPAPVAQPPVYSPDQVALIQKYAADLDQIRTRVDEIPPLIVRKDWTDVRNLIHGPLGELRFKMLNVARNLSPSTQKTAQDIAKDVFDDLVTIDAAAAEQSQKAAVDSYNDLIKDYQRFLDLIPSEPTA